MSDSERIEMQCMTDYYDHYWRGDRYIKSWTAQESAGARAPVYRNMAVPRPRLPRDNDRPIGGPDLDVNQARRGWRGSDAESDAEKQEFENRINRGEFGLLDFTRPAELELIKVLGVGGQGCAALFETTDPDGTKRKLVIKTALTNKDTAREVKNLNVRYIYRICAYKSPSRVGTDIFLLR